MLKKDALCLAESCPFDFSWHEALYSLYAMQHYEAMSNQYAPGTFYKEIWHILTGLQRTNRKTLLKHLNDPQCMVCGVDVRIAGRVLDHIVPRKLGGPDTMENTMVLCQEHNSSKGAKDLLTWWLDKGWDAKELPRNILCLYARVMWQNLDAVLSDPYDLPDATREFITKRSHGLPSAEHRLALYGSTYAAMAFRHWERLDNDTSPTLF